MSFHSLFLWKTTEGTAHFGFTSVTEAQEAGVVSALQEKVLSGYTVGVSGWFGS